MPRTRARRLLLTLATAISLVVVVLRGGAAGAAPTSRNYSVAPTPRWVAAPPATSRAEHVQGESDTGLVDVLVDDQIHVGSTLEHYVHRVRRVTTLAGVEDAGEIEFVVDPSYERFVLHGLHIERAGARIDALPKATVRASDTEADRDSHIYDGSRSVTFVLADLRVGDVIDYEGTFVGQNPVFGGKAFRRVALGSGRAGIHRRLRALFPASRPLSLRFERTRVPSTTRILDGETEVLWEVKGSAALSTETDAPRWYDDRPMFVMSELASWAEVARWAASLFEQPDRPSAALSQAIEEIRAAHESGEARALAALRFVQDDVRYLGIELGEYSHRPHAPSAVLEQRFGDCKDKASLLVAMLRALGIESHAALVSTSLEAHVEDELPSATTFDHVIVRLRLGDRTLWVDPTRSFERGPLGGAPVEYQRALVASRDTESLAKIELVAPSEPTKIVRDTFRVQGEQATLDVVTTYRGASADRVRRDFAVTPRSEIRSSYLEFYTKRFPQIEATGELTVEDDEARNVLVVREAYSIPGAVTGGRLGAAAYLVGPLVEAPSVTRRSSPLGVAHPVFLRHEIEVRGMSIEAPDDATVHDGALDFTRRTEQTADGQVVVFELRSRADNVVPADVPEHLKNLATIRSAIDLDLGVVTTPPKPVGPKAGAMDEDIVRVIQISVFIVSGIVVAGATGFRRLVVSRRRWRWQRSSTPARGETPDTAITVSSEGEAVRSALAGTWECGHHATPGEEPEVALRAVAVRGADLTSARFICGECGRARICYFEVLPPGGAPPRAPASAYRPLTWLTRAAVGSIWASALLTVLLTSVYAKAPPSPDRLTAFVFLGALGLVTLALQAASVAAIVLFLLWMHRAASNVRALGQQGLRFSPGWCVGCWFIPFAGLYKPYQALREIWRASDPTSVRGGSPRAWLGGAVPSLFPMWWSSYLVSSIVGVTGAACLSAGPLGVMLLTISEIFTLISAVAITRIMRQLDGRQAESLRAMAATSTS